LAAFFGDGAYAAKAGAEAGVKASAKAGAKAVADTSAQAVADTSAPWLRPLPASFGVASGQRYRNSLVAACYIDAAPQHFLTSMAESFCYRVVEAPPLKLARSSGRFGNRNH
jgi:hypothetical protein